MLKFHREFKPEELDFDIFTKWKSSIDEKFTWFFAGNSKTQKAILIRYYDGWNPFGIEVQGTAYSNVLDIGNVPSTKEEFIEQVYKAGNLINLMGSMLQGHILKSD